MKFFLAQILALLRERQARHNIAFLARFLTLLILMIASYCVIFHYLMRAEGQSHSWVTGLYWTLTVMSTLGFGDITFQSDAGKMFSIVVLLSGIIFILVMLPYAFIQYIYSPWLELQKKRRIPRSLAEGTHGHIILVGANPLSLDLATELKAYGMRGVVLAGDSQTTMNLVNQGYEAIMGEHDDGETYRRLRIQDAAMLVAMDSDVRNTNIVFSAREVNSLVPIAAKVEQQAAIDILELAGANRVFQFHKLLGEALARRVLYPGRRASILNRFEHLVVVEAPLTRTPLVGKSLRDSELRNATGVNIVGIWERGRIILPSPDMVFSDTTVIVAAGTPAQIEALERFLDNGEPHSDAQEVLVLGGGRVGLAAARYLKKKGHACVVVDKSMNLREEDPDITLVHGDAAALEVLEEAGLRSASSVLITTHDDDTNIYLTIYCRRLFPDVQIISRSTYERNVGILHAAGADLVLSLGSLVSNNVINMLSPGKVAMLNEGLNLFRCPAHDGRLVGKDLVRSGIREATNCSVVAVRPRKGALQINPEPSYVFAADDEIYLIGDAEAQAKCYELYGYDTVETHADDAEQTGQPSCISLTGGKSCERARSRFWEFHKKQNTSVD